jgi:hypothetical protein
MPILPRIHRPWLCALWLLLAPAASALNVENAAQLEACLESPENAVCVQTRNIVFTGNESRRLLDIATRADAITWYCVPGVGVTWNNDAGAPVDGVDVVRIMPRSGSYLQVLGCRFHTQVGGSSLAGDSTSVQLIYVRYDDPDVTRSPLVEFVGIDAQTRMTGGSTIGVGANQLGAARVNVRNSFVHAAIAVDVKARGRGQPVPFEITDSVLESEPGYDLPRCWKQLNDAVLTDVRGTVCRYGQLQFNDLEAGTAAHEHDLDGLTLEDSPSANVKGREMIVLGGGHSLRGEISIRGVGAAGPATLLNASTAGVVDLVVRYEDCHRSYSGEGGGALLTARNARRIDQMLLRVTGPNGCSAAARPISDSAMKALASSATTGFLTRDDELWTFVDGAVVASGECQLP